MAPLLELERQVVNVLGDAAEVGIVVLRDERDPHLPLLGSVGEAERQEDGHEVNRGSAMKSRVAQHSRRTDVLRGRSGPAKLSSLLGDISRILDLPSAATDRRA
jgi:hypothetical protein